MKTKHMQRIRTLSSMGVWVLIGVLALTVASCAIWTSGSEGSTITMSLAASSKALGSGADEARVWVYSNNVLVANPATSDGSYRASIDPGASTATVTVSDLAPGESYRVVAVTGTSGSTFKPTAFGTSDLFGIKAGVETTVSLNLDEIDVAVPSSQISGLKSVVVAGDIYAASGTKIYVGQSVDNLLPVSWNPSTVTINSLNLTADEPPQVLVNTTSGVYNYGGNAVGGSWGSDVPPSVLQSGGLALLDTYFYQADKEIGGYVGGNEWNRIPLDIPVAGKPILDLLVWKKDENTMFGYFATRVVGAFRVGSSDIADLTLDDILSGNENSPIIFFGETLPLIQAFGYLSGDDLYLGTKSGVYKTKINDPKSSPATLLEGTKGLNVTKIVVQGQSEAFLTATEIVLLKDNKIYKMPFFSSVVGELTDIAWQGSTLIITGTTGICSLDTTSLGK